MCAIRYHTGMENSRCICYGMYCDTGMNGAKTHFQEGGLNNTGSVQHYSVLD